MQPSDMTDAELDAALSRLALLHRDAPATRRQVVGRVCDRVLDELLTRRENAANVERMSPRAIILGLAALFAIAGLSFGLTTVHSGDTSCGSALQPQSTTFQADLDAIDQGDRATGCHDAISGRKPIAYGSLGIAAIALIVGFTASSSKPTNADGSEKPSIWR